MTAENELCPAANLPNRRECLMLLKNRVMILYDLIGKKYLGKRITYFSSPLLLLHDRSVRIRSVQAAAQNIFFYLLCDLRMLRITEPYLGQKLGLLCKNPSPPSERSLLCCAVPTAPIWTNRHSRSVFTTSPPKHPRFACRQVRRRKDCLRAPWRRKPLCFPKVP